MNSDFAYYVSVIAQFISIVVGAVTIGLVFYGFSAWKRDRKRILGEEVLALFYQARDDIHYMRYGWGAYSSEDDSLKQRENESDDKYSVRCESSIFELRYMQRNEVFAKIDGIKYRFKVIYGNADYEVFIEFKKILDDIFSAIRAFRHLRLEQIKSKDDDDKKNAKIQRYEDVFESVDDNDEINKRLNKVIEKAEKICTKKYK
jgi:hypothetical protein